MKLKAVLTSLEDLSDELKALYEEKDGKFYLQVEPVEGWSLEDVQGLKSSLAKERENVGKLEADLKKFEDIDPKKARDALSKVEEMAGWTPEEKVREQIEAREKKLVEKHSRELEERDSKVSTLTTQLEKHLVESAATAALTKHKGNVELLLPHVRSQVRVEADKEGNFTARVVGPDGTPRLSPKQGSTDQMSIDELVETMREMPTYAAAFEGTGASGSGAGGSTGRSGSQSGPHRISYKDAKEPRKYRAAKERAEKAGATLEVEAPPLGGASSS